MHDLLIYEALLLEMRREAVTLALGEEDGNKLLKFTQDDSYHHLVVNTVKNGEPHTVKELLDADLLKRFKDLGISTAWNTNKTLTAETAGASVTLDKQTSGYNDFVRFTEIKSGLTTKTPLLIALIDDNYERSNKHFNVLINDSEWYIVYPKTQLGSMSLGRSYWNREQNKLKYDDTFNDGEGSYTGKMSWCTVINGSNNRFVSYHINMRLHMFYCISKRFGPEDNKRKLCLSLSKVKEEVKFSGGYSSVDGDNASQDENFFKTTLGSRYDKLIKYTEDNLEEIDPVTYYSSYNLVQYNSAFENPRVEVDIEQAANELKLMLKHTKDVRIFEAMFNSERDKEIKHQILAQSEKTPSEILNKLAESGNSELQIAIAKNHNTSLETFNYLIKVGDLDIKQAIASNPNTSYQIFDYLVAIGNLDIQRAIASNPNTPSEILKDLLKIDDRNIKINVASNPNTSSEIFDYLVATGNLDIQKAVASNPNTTFEILKDLLKIDNRNINITIADNPNTPSEILQYLARIDDIHVQTFVARNPNTPSKTLKYLSEIDNYYIKLSIAYNTNTSYETFKYLSEIDAYYIQLALIRNPNCPEDIKKKLKEKGIIESYIKEYIKLLIN